MTEPRAGVPPGKIALDLGCGNRKRPGCIGVDAVRLPGVDVVCDLEGNLPFRDDSIDAIHSNFFVEHVANTVRLFQEIYRICKHGAVVEFRVPFYQSMTQYKDPTHRAIILPEMMEYFGDRKWYGSDYGIGTNFKLLDVKYDYLPPFDAMASKKYFFAWPVTYPILRFARRFLWNVVHSITIRVQVVKQG